MITSYEGIETLSDDLVDLWGDGLETSELVALNEKDGAQEKKAPPPAPSGVRNTTRDNQLESQPYYVYKYYMEAIRELVGDMGFNTSEKEIRQKGRQMWPKYSNKLNVVREAEQRHKEEGKYNVVAKEKQRDERGNNARLLRRKAKTGMWSNVLNTAWGDPSRADIESEPYYVYKYFMNLVRQQSRGMGFNHTMEDIQRMGANLWPTFAYKDFLVGRALAQYRSDLKAAGNNNNNNKEIKHGGVDEETQTEDEAPLKTTEQRKPKKRSHHDRNAHA